VKPTSLLLVFLSVAFALTGCNKKPSAPAEQQPVAEQQRVLPEQAPEQPSTSQQPAALLQAPVRPLQAPVQPLQAPVQPLQAPVQPLQAPVQPVQAPVQPVQAPVPPPETAASPSEVAAASPPEVAATSPPEVAATSSPEVAATSSPEVAESPPQALASTQQEGAPPQSLTPSSVELTPTPEPLQLPQPPADLLATRVGLFVPLTGSQASFGLDALNGAKLAVDEINEQGGVLDHPVNLLVKDTESRTEQIAAVVGELIDTEKVVALIGEITTDRTLVAAPLAQERGIPLITPSATNEKITAVGNYVFRACYIDAFQAAMMTKFARSLDVDKVAMLFDGNNPYGTSLSSAFKVDFVKQGGSIVAEESYRGGDVDYATQLNAIKLKNPDIVFLPSYFAEAAVIIKQARQLGIEVPFLGTDGWDSSELLKSAGQAVNNCYFASHFSSEHLSERAKSFSAAYRGKFQAPPPPLAALTYDAVRLLVDALKRGGSTNSTALRDALAETKDFAGVTGTIAFDQDRNPKKPGVILRVQDGKFTYLESVEP
jgi:branched-chain amino acid transport system substrate-binding protein